MDITHIIWWVVLALIFICFWQSTKALQSLAETFRRFEELIKKFENVKITELPASAPAAPVAPVAAAPAVAQVAPPVSAPAPAPAAASDSIPGEIVAVIAAAVDAVMAGPHRILSISPAEHQLSGPNPFQTALAWSAEGRRHIFQSHKLR